MGQFWKNFVQNYLKFTLSRGINSPTRFDCRGIKELINFIVILCVHRKRCALRYLRSRQGSTPPLHNFVIYPLCFYAYFDCDVTSQLVSRKGGGASDSKNQAYTTEILTCPSFVLRFCLYKLVVWLVCKNVNSIVYNNYFKALLKTKTFTKNAATLTLIK